MIKVVNKTEERLSKILSNGPKYDKHFLHIQKLYQKRSHPVVLTTTLKC